MKLIDISTGDTLNLPSDLVWTDEFSWCPTAGEYAYSLTGALLYEVGDKQSGREITLVAPDDTMAWVSRATMLTLKSWLQPATRKMRLKLEYPTDTREFVVMFKHGADPISASPVTTFASHDPGDWFKVSLKLLEVPL